MKYLFLIITITISSFSFGQHEADEKTEDNEDVKVIHHKHEKYLRFALFLGHTFVALDSKGNHSPIPSWGFDIEYWHSHKLGFGFHNDVEILNYVIETSQTEFIERDFPLVLTADILYRPWKDLVLFVGIGKEFEKTEDFFIYRMGVEYEIPFGDNWDMCPSFFYDSRRKAFNTYTIMLGIGKSF